MFRRPPALANSSDVGLKTGVAQFPASCSTVYVAEPNWIVPVWLELILLLTPTENERVPDVVPRLAEVIVIQLAGTASQGQPPGTVTLTDPVPPVPGSSMLVAEREMLHSTSDGMSIFATKLLVSELFVGVGLALSYAPGVVGISV
jgi:hypothetical protein